MAELANDAPTLSFEEAESVVQEDSWWSAVPAGVVDDSDEILTVRASARAEAELETFVVTTSALELKTDGAVHVISLSNRSNASLPVHAQASKTTGCDSLFVFLFSRVVVDW